MTVYCNVEECDHLDQTTGRCKMINLIIGRHTLDGWPVCENFDPNGVS